MIHSMTGFGRGRSRGAFGVFTAELKTLNHKFLEITYKLPNSLAIFDDRVKELINKSVARGKVYLNLTHEETGEASALAYIDHKIASSYYKKLKKLKKELSAEGEIKFSDIIAFPGVINYKPASKNTEKMWPFVQEAVLKALKKLVRDREKEGSFLIKDVDKRLGKIKRIVQSIKDESVSNIKEYKKRLSQRIKELSGGYRVDKERLAVEVALFAKNTDITEELTRLANHIKNFTQTMRKKGEVGKKLDFISQELHREINTVGSKSSGFNISKGVIEAKTEIEKIREQLKNIE